jgi:hypothetical protein
LFDTVQERLGRSNQLGLLARGRTRRADDQVLIGAERGYLFDAGCVTDPSLYTLWPRGKLSSIANHCRYRVASRKRLRDDTGSDVSCRAKHHDAHVIKLLFEPLKVEALNRA